MIAYKATCVANGKVYIGVTGRSLDHRMREHRSHAKSPRSVFHKAIAAHGWESFRWEIVGTACSAEELGRLEVALVAAHRSNDKRYGYNRTGGGWGTAGLEVGRETREKLSAAGRGRIVSETTREKLRQNAKNRDLSAMRAAVKGRKKSQAEIEKMLANRADRTGYRHTKMAVENMRLAQSVRRERDDKLKPSMRAEVLALKEQGLSLRMIGDKYGCTASAVCHYLKRLSA